MDRNEILNDPETAIRYGLQGLQSQIWTSFPAIVESVDLTTMTLECVPAIKGVNYQEDGSKIYVTMPVLVDVPIVFPSAGGFSITFPIAVGDEVLVVIGCRCIDAWWQSGGIQQPIELRMHDLSDGFAIPGPRSQPRVVSGISSTDIQIRNDSGTCLIGMGTDTKISFQNSTVSLKKTLTDLQSALNIFMTTLAGFSGGGSPVTQAMLQAPASTCETALANVLTEIGELLK